ncbi:hypothetical protein [Salisediminibacterium beveridgei]|nr:hypothetical protein [Salisediminibacterium beveridgei]
MKKLITGMSLATLLVVAACGNDNEGNEDTNVNAGGNNTEENASNNQEANGTNDSDDAADEIAEDGWETEVGETVENEGGVFTLHARADDIDTIETGPVVMEVEQLNAQSGELSGEMADFMETDQLELIQMDISVENTSDEDIMFYADQAEIATSTGEQLQADMWLSDHLGGDMMGNTSSSGTIFFVLENSNAEDVEDVRITWSAPNNEDFESIGEDVDITVEY